MRERGVTMVEMLMVFVIVGIMTAFAFPRIRDGVNRENVRGARALMSTYHAKARYLSILRRTVDTLHYLPDGSVWITAPAMNPTAVHTLDTLDKPIDNVYRRYGVYMKVEPSSRVSLVFDPRGIGTETSNTVFYFTKGRFSDSLIVSPTGRIK